jgi:hypothetical protein
MQNVGYARPSGTKWSRKLVSFFIQFLNFFLQGYTVVLKIKMLGQRSMQFEVESN